MTFIRSMTSTPSLA